MRRISNENVHNTASCLKEIRESRGLSQGRFAQSLGVSLRSYQYYEGGARALPIELLGLLAEQGVSLEWLLLGRGSRDLPAENELEELKVLAEYWRANYQLLEASLKLARTRVKEKYGEDVARELLESLMPPPAVELMFPHTAARSGELVGVAEKEGAKRKGKVT